MPLLATSKLRTNLKHDRVHLGIQRRSVRDHAFSLVRVWQDDLQCSGCEAVRLALLGLAV